jgi:hypothetical protein
MPASDGSPACDKRLEVGQIHFQIGNDIVPHPLGLAFGVAILGGKAQYARKPDFLQTVGKLAPRIAPVLMRGPFDLVPECALRSGQ